MLLKMLLLSSEKDIITIFMSKNTTHKSVTLTNRLRLMVASATKYSYWYSLFDTDYFLYRILVEKYIKNKPLQYIREIIMVITIIS